MHHLARIFARGDIASFLARGRYTLTESTATTATTVSNVVDYSETFKGHIRSTVELPLSEINLSSPTLTSNFVLTANFLTKQ